MIFPHIEKILRALSDCGSIAFEEDLTIGEIFSKKPGKLPEGIQLLNELTAGSSDKVTAETSIGELKQLIMQSAEKSIQSFGFNPKKVRGAFRRLQSQ